MACAARASVHGHMCVPHAADCATHPHASRACVRVRLQCSRCWRHQLARARPSQPPPTRGGCPPRAAARRMRMLQRRRPAPSAAPTAAARSRMRDTSPRGSTTSSCASRTAPPRSAKLRLRRPSKSRSDQPNPRTKRQTWRIGRLRHRRNRWKRKRPKSVDRRVEFPKNRQVRCFVQRPGPVCRPPRSV